MSEQFSLLVSNFSFSFNHLSACSFIVHDTKTTLIVPGTRSQITKQRTTGGLLHQMCLTSITVLLGIELVRVLGSGKMGHWPCGTTWHHPRSSKIVSEQKSISLLTSWVWEWTDEIFGKDKAFLTWILYTLGREDPGKRLVGVFVGYSEILW